MHKHMSICRPLMNQKSYQNGLTLPQGHQVRPPMRPTAPLHHLTSHLSLPKLVRRNGRLPQYTPQKLKVTCTWTSWTTTLPVLTHPMSNLPSGTEGVSSWRTRPEEATKRPDAEAFTTLRRSSKPRRLRETVATVASINSPSRMRNCAFLPHPTWRPQPLSTRALWRDPVAGSDRGQEPFHLRAERAILAHLSVGSMAFKLRHLGYACTCGR